MRVYALKNQEYTDSSSGGAFPTLAKTLYEMVGDSLVVYGAAFDEHFQVKHRGKKYVDSISCFYESKYVRSEITRPIQEIPDLLKDGIPVLFVGTPCQVAAIKAKVAKERINDSLLYTIDLICHGTPKAELWNKYVDLLTSKYGKIKKISFRYKGLEVKKAGRPFLMLEDGTLHSNPKELETYMRLFSSCISLHSGCFSCKYRNSKPYRPGDITIGDFWGVSEVIRGFDQDGDVSLLLTNTDKGQFLLDRIAPTEKLKIMECVTDKYRVFNPHLFKQTKKPEIYDSFWNDYRMMDIEELNYKYSKISIKARMKKALSSFLSRLGIKWKVKKLFSHG